MQSMAGQGAIGLSCGSTAGNCRGQGATEYLVLLAVVLIIALVGIALLGFFPGTANDAQITESQIYWESAGPIAIVESGATVYAANPTISFPYMRFRNTAAYPIRITGIIGADGGKATQFFSYTTCGASAGWVNINDYFYLGPGEERYLGHGYGTPCDWQINALTSSSTSHDIGGATSICQNSTASPGVLSYKSLGFEYIQYVENQQITKRQIGKAFIVKCQ